MDAELESKKLELLKEVVPRATTIAFLVNPDGAMTEIRVRDMRAAARARGLGLHVLNARTKYDLNATFAKFGELAAGAMAILRKVYSRTKARYLANWQNATMCRPSRLTANLQQRAG